MLKWCYKIFSQDVLNKVTNIMSFKQSEIESIIDGAIEDVLELAIAGNFTKLKDIEYALEYLKGKLEEIDPTDFIS
jgi:hypothetical protein